MKFVRLWVGNDSLTGMQLGGHVQVEVAKIQFEITLSTEALDGILRAIKPDIDEGVKRLAAEIGVTYAERS